MNIKQKFIAPEIELADGVFEAVAWPYGAPDRVNDVIERGAFTKSLERLAATNTAMPLLWEHERGTPIGALPVLKDTDAGLLVRGELELSIEKAQQAYSLAKRKALSLSISFAYDEKNVTERDGQRFYSEVDLLEISLVTVPANSGAVLTKIKSLDDVSSIRDFEVLVRDALGLSRRQSKQLAAVGYPALIECDAQPVEELDQQAILKALDSATTSIKSIKL